MPSVHEGNTYPEKNLRIHIREFRNAVIPGIFSGILVVIISISLTALIFSGELSGYFAEGFALSINTAVIVGLFTLVFSKCQPVITMADEDTAPVFALLASFIVANQSPETSPEMLFSIVVSTFVVSTLLTGLGLTALGLLRIGRMVEFLPHSVMGGYFAAIGWLLLTGGFQVSLGGNAVIPDDPVAILAPGELVRWFPAVLFSITLLFLRRRLPRSMLLSGAVLLSLLAFVLFLAFSRYTLDDLLQGGYLIGPFASDEGGLFHAFSGLSVIDIDWSPVWLNDSTIASILLISTLSVTLSISGIGFLTRTDVTMNRELTVAGTANILSAMGGGLIGLPSYSLTSLAVDMGAQKNVWPGLFTVVICVLVFLFGMDLVAFLPRFLLSGILMYLGLALIQEWLLEGWQKFDFTEYLAIPVILLVSVFAGFLQGILFGIIAAVVLFVVTYSRINPVRYTATGSQLMSNVDRIPAERNYIREHGNQVLIWGLHGYLFFGTIGKLYKMLSSHIGNTTHEQLRFLVIDASRVTGIDASASLNFQRLEQLVRMRNIILILAGLDTVHLMHLQKDGFGRIAGDHLVVEPDLDRGIEWCENAMLAADPALRQQGGYLDQLVEYITPEGMKILYGYLNKIHIDAGYFLTRQGDESHELFFLESCAASVYITDVQGKTHRIRHSKQGTIFGEMGFYLHTRRSATVIADEPGVVYVLDETAMAKLQNEHPNVASGLHNFMAKLISERLLFTTETLNAIQI